MRLYSLLGPAALLLLAACQPTTLLLRVKAPPGSNQGRPLYMLVRKVDPKQYAVESYGEVSARLFNPDESMLLSEVIYPGTMRRLKVKLPAESPVAVSFLFTAPDGTWQTFVNTPAPPALDIELLEGRIRMGAPPAEPTKKAGGGGAGGDKPPQAQAPALPKLPLEGSDK